MTTITRTFLPEVLRHNGKEYVQDIEFTDRYRQKLLIHTKGLILVKVREKKKKGSIDLDGKQNLQTEWIFTRKEKPWPL